MKEQIKLAINKIDLTTEEREFQRNSKRRREKENGENILENLLILLIKNKMILISITC